MRSRTHINKPKKHRYGYGTQKRGYVIFQKTRTRTCRDTLNKIYVNIYIHVLTIHSQDYFFKSDMIKFDFKPKLHY